MQSRKLRIAFATPEYVTEEYFDGGLANYLHRAATTLAAMGHDVHLLTLSSTDSTSFRHNNVTVHRLMLGRWTIINHLLRHHFNTTAYWLNFSARVYRRLRELHNELPFDVVQFPNYSYCGLLSIMFGKIPYALRGSSDEPFFHDRLQEKTLDFRMLQFLDKLQYRRSRFVFTPSRGLRDLLSQNYAVRASVVPNVVYTYDGEWDHLIFENNLKGREYLLFFGRFERRKGFEILLEALRQVLAERNDVTAVLIGRDVHTTQVPSMAAHARFLLSEFAERVVILPPLPHSQLCPIISHARLIVLPSVTDNLPNACLEAMAMGKVVVGTHRSTLDEVITDGWNGFLAEPGNAQSLTQKIVAAWNNENLEDIGRAARETMKQFSRENAAEALLNYYQQIINTNGNNHGRNS